MEKRIVVANRVHPDECGIGDQVDQLFAEGSIPGVHLVTRTVPEDARKQRGLVPGSNTALRRANPAGDLDEQFLWEITKAAQHAKVVLDIHGHRLKTAPSYPFYSESARYNQLVLGIASLLCSDEALLHPATLYLAGDLPCPYAGWDLAPGTDVKALRPILERLGAGECPPVRPMTEYIYLRGIFEADGVKYGFKREYKQFEPLPKEAVAKLGLPKGSCAFDWNVSLNSHAGTDFWGEVVVPLPEGPHSAPS